VNEFENGKIIFTNDTQHNETKHVLFMSLFENVILSNSTYPEIAGKLNLNENKILIHDPNNISSRRLCYGTMRTDDYCGMSYESLSNGNYHWKNVYDFFIVFIEIL
jgi:hypothetical protein